MQTLHPATPLPTLASRSYVIWKFITDPTVGQNGVMTKRASRTGVDAGGLVPLHLLTPASAMPLMRGITPASIN